MILKFTMAGKLVMQIGHRGQSKGNTDTDNVHQPADTFVDARASELYVADGYGDQRIVVFDTNTGKFKRMWGAFGNAPTPEMKPNPPVPQPQEPGTEGPQQFGLPHAVKVSTDGTVTLRTVSTTGSSCLPQPANTCGPCASPTRTLPWCRFLQDSRSRRTSHSSISTLSTPVRCAWSSSIGRR